MKNITLALLLVSNTFAAGLSVSPEGDPKAPLLPARFFANPAIQDQAPGAFAVQASAVPALQGLARIAPAQRDALVAAIRADSALSDEVKNWATIGWPRQEAAIRKIMDLECTANRCAIPPLVVHGPDEIGRGPAYFEFTPDTPGTGIVHLWPRHIAEETNPYAGLLLAIHETRHSWQFQVAFNGKHGCGVTDPAIVAAFASGFRAQKALDRKLSFCDFCTMHHEHEAFQTGNYVVGMLTGWSVDTNDMGCHSSQFDASGVSKIDILKIAEEYGADQILTVFNMLEKPQFISFGGQSN